MNRIKMKMISKKDKPSYSNSHAAGLDLRYIGEEKLIFSSGDHHMIGSGIHVEIPDGYFGLVAIRSGLGAKGLVLSNGVGIIDNDYRGEIKVPLYYHGEGELVIEPGERVCQLLILPFVQADIEYVDKLEKSDRGHDGFGSSGRF